MKKSVLPFLFFLFSFTSMQALDASIAYATFKSPEQNYAEIYLHLVGNTVNFITIDSGQYQASVEVIILFKQYDQIVKYDKYRLNSPISAFPTDFIDQKRFGLKDGAYELEISVNDLNMEDNAKSFKKVFTVDFSKDKIEQSDIQLLSSFKEDPVPSDFTKNGFYLESLPFNFYGRNASRLTFYNEIYNTDQVLTDEFLIRYFVEKVESNGQSKMVMMGNKKQSPKPVNVLLVQKNIMELKSGNYNLVIEVRNRQDELLSSKKMFFQRANPLLDESEILNTDLQEEFVKNLDGEELQYSLRAIAMNVKNSDVEILNMVIAGKDLAPKRRFLFTFWAGQNPNDPGATYEKYMEVARAVDKLYRSGFGFGFETDRGYTFMKYGKPNDIMSVDNDPSAPPYEIWAYNEFPVTQQNNVKFIFYNASLDGGNYVMLHSTARGEMRNPQWEVELYRNAPNDGQTNNFIDNSQMGDNFNRQARKFFNDM